MKFHSRNQKNDSFLIALSYLLAIYFPQLLTNKFYFFIDCISDGLSCVLINNDSGFIVKIITTPLATLINCPKILSLMRTGKGLQKECIKR